MVSGPAQLQIRGRADPARVLPRHPGRQGRRAELEEVHLQGDLAARRPRARVLQVAELSRTVGVSATSTRRTQCFGITKFLEQIHWTNVSHTKILRHSHLGLQIKIIDKKVKLNY